MLVVIFLVADLLLTYQWVSKQTDDIHQWLLTGPTADQDSGISASVHTGGKCERGVLVFEVSAPNNLQKTSGDGSGNVIYNSLVNGRAVSNYEATLGALWKLTCSTSDLVRSVYEQRRRADFVPETINPWLKNVQIVEMNTGGKCMISEWRAGE